VAIADFNGDGIPDLVATDLTLNLVSVLLGNGDGTFTPPIQYKAGPMPTSVATADLNGNGKPDLVIDNDQTNGTVSVLLNQSTAYVNTYPASGVTRTKVAVAGSDFQAGETVKVTYAATPTTKVAICSAVVAANRSFACSGAIPIGTKAGKLGAHTITATGVTSHRTAKSTFTLD
jgi:hypothetical protein